MARKRIVASESTTAPAKTTATVLLVNEPQKKKWQSFAERAFWSVVLVAGFVAIILAGHLYLILLVLAIQVGSFKEITALASVPAEEKKLPWVAATNWVFFIAFNYLLYGESLLMYFHKEFMIDAFLSVLAKNHMFISYSLYVLGLVFFVLTLKKGHYRFQFTQFAFAHMALFFVVAQPMYIIENLLEGIIWFLLPVFCVIINDTTAYLSGFFFGRTPLIQLSPKKTWEGFLGAFILTLIFGVLTSFLLQQVPYLICPVQSLTIVPFETLLSASCEIAPVFKQQAYLLSPFFQALFARLGLPIKILWIAPLQWHSLSIAFFASMIAPFGGFFASGLKRAYSIKDFANTIPGHGGITDRFDCQFVMGSFAFVYYQTFVKVAPFEPVVHLLELIIALPTEQQLDVFHSLQQYLNGQGLLEH